MMARWPRDSDIDDDVGPVARRVDDVGYGGTTRQDRNGGNVDCKRRGVEGSSDLSKAARPRATPGSKKECGKDQQARTAADRHRECGSGEPPSPSAEVAGAGSPPRHVGKPSWADMDEDSDESEWVHTWGRQPKSLSRGVSSLDRVERPQRDADKAQRARAPLRGSTAAETSRGDAWAGRVEFLRSRYLDDWRSGQARQNKVRLPRTIVQGKMTSSIERQFVHELIPMLCDRRGVSDLPTRSGAEGGALVTVRTHRNSKVVLCCMHMHKAYMCAMQMDRRANTWVFGSSQSCA